MCAQIIYANVFEKLKIEKQFRWKVVYSENLEKSQNLENFNDNEDYMLETLVVEILNSSTV